MINLDVAFLPNQDQMFDKDFLAYGFSLSAKQWGMLRVDGKDPLLYICEIPTTQVGPRLIGHCVYLVLTTCTG